MVYPRLGAPCPAGLTEGPQSAASPKHAAVLIPLSGPRSILEAQPLTCPCVFQLLGLQEDVCTVKVSPRRGTLGPNEERQLSLELTAHTLVSVEPRAALPGEAPGCLHPCQPGGLPQTPVLGQAGIRFLALGSGAPFLLGLLSRDTGSGRLEQAGIGPETPEHHP